MKLPKCKYPKREMDLAVLQCADVGFEDHGLFVMSASFDYGGCGQGLGYVINQKFIEKFIEAFGVMLLSECKGEIFVEHTRERIDRLIPLQTSKGNTFDIKGWSDDTKEKHKIKEGGD